MHAACGGEREKGSELGITCPPDRVPQTPAGGLRPPALPAELLRKKAYLMQEQANKTHYSWRTELEIDFERQEFLRQQLAVRADIQRGVYPFKGVSLESAE